MNVTEAAARAITLRDGVMRVDVQVQPRASRSGFSGFLDGRLKVALTAPPVDGAANDALIALFAKELGRSRSQVRIERGQTGRKKTIAVSGADDALVAKLLAACA